MPLKKTRKTTTECEFSLTYADVLRLAAEATGESPNRLSTIVEISLYETERRGTPKLSDEVVVLTWKTVEAEK